MTEYIDLSEESKSNKDNPITTIHQILASLLKTNYEGRYYILSHTTFAFKLYKRFHQINFVLRENACDVWLHNVLAEPNKLVAEYSDPNFIKIITDYVDNIIISNKNE